MKYLILLLLSFNVFAEGMIVDPNIYSFYNIQCDYPTERIDNTPLAITEIESIKFYISTPLTEWEIYDTNFTECGVSIDVTTLPDNQYYITSTANDVSGLASTYSLDELVTKGALAFEVKRGAGRLQPLRPPTNLRGSLVLTQ